MSKRYQLICSDPPWSMRDALKMSDVKRGASSNYSTMTTEEIRLLPVDDITDPSGSVLALWVPSSILADGLAVMQAWQFDMKQTWIWLKIKKDPFAKLKKANQIDWDHINWDDFMSFGMGRVARNVHEVVLIGTRGKVYSNIKNKSQRTVFCAPNTKHSQKPELLQDKLELLLPTANKIELFARRQRKGWDCVGNEIDGQDIRDVLPKLM